MKDFPRAYIHRSDGHHCYQVLVYDDSDLEYYQLQAEQTGHLIKFDRHIDENAMGKVDPAHDIYQIFPPEMASYFK